MIGYYIHHHGKGHLTRASTIAARIGLPVTALTSMDVPSDLTFADHVQLEMDTSGSNNHNPTAHGAFHWAPTHHPGLRSRMTRIAEWISDARPQALVVDVSAEVAVFARLMGVPVVVVAMPGARDDDAHQLVYKIADHIIAAWPKEIYDPDWLRDFHRKTTYVGGISRFDGRQRVTDLGGGDPRPQVLVMSGAGGSHISRENIQSCASQHDSFRWKALGVGGEGWLADPWNELCSSDIIVTHAGQNAVADVATAQRPAIVVAEERPFDEQAATARALSEHQLCLSLRTWPATDQWPTLIEEAKAIGVHRWSKWRTAGAADRAAAIIRMVSERGPRP